MLAANEAEKKVEAAVKALADAESEYNVLAQKIQNVESEKVEKGRELVNQSWIYNFLNESEDATKQAILQKKQSIATSSALNEEAKKMCIRDSRRWSRSVPSHASAPGAARLSPDVKHR